MLTAGAEAVEKRRILESPVLVVSKKVLTVKFILDHFLLLTVWLFSAIGLVWPWLSLRGQYEVSPQQAVTWMNRETGDRALVWDVRSPQEFAQNHIPKAKNVPLTVLLKQLQGLKHKDQALLMVCQMGKRARQAAAQARQAGFSRVYVLEGGMQAWVQAQLPVKRA
jgi:rhodanese-related sulfurtransferase